MCCWVKTNMIGSFVRQFKRHFENSLSANTWDSYAWMVSTWHLLLSGLYLLSSTCVWEANTWEIRFRDELTLELLLQKISETVTMQVSFDCFFFFIFPQRFEPKWKWYHQNFGQRCVIHKTWNRVVATSIIKKLFLASCSYSATSIVPSNLVLIIHFTLSHRF